MRTRVTAATAVLLLATLAACGGGDDETDAAPKAAASSSTAVDCTDQTLDQAEWTEHCADEAAGTGGDGTEGQATGLAFGESYTWSDGLKVTVVEARVFTDYDAELLESAEPGVTDFRVKLKLENTGDAAVSLDELLPYIEGTTNGGEAASTSFENGSEPLEGRLGAGQTVTKTSDNSLETKYGRDIVVTVQRITDDFTQEDPEFEGEIVD